MKKSILNLIMGIGLVMSNAAFAAVSGVVTDYAGAPVVGATVAFVTQDHTAVAVTDLSGAYGAELEEIHLPMVVTVMGNDIETMVKDLIATQNTSTMDFVVTRRGSGLDLTILHTNDVHSHLSPYAMSGAGSFGGSAVVAEQINVIRNQRDHVLYLDAGDQFVGSPLFSLFEGECEYTLLNMMGVAAYAPGNHEFDYGPERLAKFVDGLDCPVVCANLNAAKEPLLQDRIQPCTTLTVGGRRIGVVGCLSEETAWISKPGDTVSFEDVVSSVQDAVGVLTTQGVDIIICLSHASYETDKRIAATVPGVDVIVGGHSHTLLSDTDTAAAGPYPTVIDGVEGNQVLIVQVQDWNRYLGDLKVTFDNFGLVTAWSGAPILMSAGLPKNTEVAAYLADKEAQAKTLYGRVIGQNLVAVSNDTARTGECALANLVTDAFLWEMSPEGYEIAITNGGGIRAPLNEGDVTIEDVMTVLPFDNYLATCKLTGENIKKVLENGLTRINIPADGETGTGRFAQVAGMRYTYDRTRAKYDRILSIEVRNADGSFSPIDPARVYKVVTNDFMRQGGDEYTVLKTEATDPYDFGRKLSDVLIDYVTAHTPIMPVLEGRIVEVSGR